VVEQVVEVEPDKAALVEQLRVQMKAEIEAQQQQQIGAKPLKQHVRRQRPGQSNSWRYEGLRGLCDACCNLKQNSVGARHG